ncbi:MAG: SpaA isopeptide-forming pilin-related protein [Defluviitaleaceae bacterium]|nr:SpaA isopeptide-forming pilin-related protein [Defluviitaleaceae bacterium]
MKPNINSARSSLARKLIALVLTACLLANINIFSFVSADDGQQVAAVIKGVELRHNGAVVQPGSEIDFKNGDMFFMDFKWKLHDDVITVNDGDYALIQLWEPGTLPVNIDYGSSGLNGKIYCDGEEIGVFIIGYGGTDGCLRMVFNNRLTGDMLIEGTISIETYIDYGFINDVKQTVSFFYEEFEFTFYYARTAGGGSPLIKSSAEPAYAGSPGHVEKIHWQIDVNTLLDASPSNTVLDTLTAAGAGNAGHSIDPGSVKIFQLEVDVKNNSEKEGVLKETQITAGYSVSVAPNGQTMTVAFDDISRKAYRIKYDTIPADKGSELKYGNTAASGGNISEAHIIIEIPPPEEIIIDKYGTLHQPADKPAFIRWSMSVNSSNVPVKGGIVIKDEIRDKNQSEFNFYEAGNISAIDFVIERRIKNSSWNRIAPENYGTDFVVSEWISGDNGGFTLTIAESALKDASNNYYEFNIQFNTEVTGTSYFNNSSYYWINYMIVNGNEHRGSASSSNNGIEKTAGAADASTRTIPWTITVNPRGSAFANISIADLFDCPLKTEMTLIEDSLTVKLGNTTLVKGAVSNGYTVSNNGSDGFGINFTSDVLVSDQSLVVAYNTLYENKSGNAINFENTASVYASTNGGEVGLIGSPKSAANVKDTNFWNTAYKTGTYANGKLNWKIVFNHTDTVDVTENVILEDHWRLSSTNQLQILDMDSLEIIPPDVVVVRFEESEDKKGFTLELANINDREVEISYSTYRAGQPIENYYNYAFLRAGEFTGGQFSGGAVGLSTEMIKKDSVLGSDKTINWSLTVNAAEYDIKSAVIIDKLGKGQLLEASTVVVSRLKNNGGLDALQPVKDIDYTINVFYNPATGETTLTVMFLDGYSFNSMHMLAYTSKVDDDAVERNASNMYEVSNKASLSGSLFVSEEVERKVANNWTVVSGSGSGVRAPVYVEKLDSDSKTALKNAEFKLTDKTGTVDYITGIVTEADGKAFLGRLGAGEYRLYEVKAPDGYVLNTNADHYKEFTVNSTNVQGFTVTFENDKLPTPEPTLPPGVSPTPSPVPTSTPTPSPTPTPTPTPTSTPTQAPSPSPTVTPTPSPTASPTPTQAPSPSPTVSPTPVSSPTTVPSPTTSPTPLPSPSPTPPPISLPTPTPTYTPTQAPSPSPSPSPSPTPSPSPVPYYPLPDVNTPLTLVAPSALLPDYMPPPGEPITPGTVKLTGIGHDPLYYEETEYHDVFLFFDPTKTAIGYFTPVYDEHGHIYEWFETDEHGIPLSVIKHNPETGNIDIRMLILIMSAGILCAGKIIKRKCFSNK